jgi:Rad3-related DNA helicase
MTQLNKSKYIDNFPFPTLRTNQGKILQDTEQAFNSGYRYVICELPTGTGKSPIGVAVAMAQDSSYICTSTKNLQSQYVKDFPWVLQAKGRNNFRCPILEEDPRAPCKTADHAPCVGNNDYKCPLKTRSKDYYTQNTGTKNEVVIFDKSVHMSQFIDYDDDSSRICEYYHQRNRALAASHSVLNYSMFLSLLGLFPTRPLLILDEAHELPSEVLKFQSFFVSKIKWQKYLGQDFQIPLLGIDDIRGWIEFLIGLKESVSKRLMLSKVASDIADIERKIVQRQFDQLPVQGIDMKIEQLREMLKPLNEQIQSSKRFKNLAGEPKEDITKLHSTISQLLSEPLNWIVTDIRFDAVRRTVAKVEFKPLNVSKKCRGVFEKGRKVLMISATILDTDTFCRDIGLDPKDVKVIKCGSNFPVINRPTYYKPIAQLNKDTLQREDVKQAIVKAVDEIMNHYARRKGIIHTTSYDMVNFLMLNVSAENKKRLLKTDPNIERDLVIEKHCKSTEATVLISPSLHLGLNLRDNFSRFQVIVKLPYANLGDRWVKARYDRPGGQRWYQWVSTLRLVQAYGRSVRSETDWAHTYILDGNFPRFIRMNRIIVPEWFYESIQW